jgi:hypothetical protein
LRHRLVAPSWPMTTCLRRSSGNRHRRRRHPQGDSTRSVSSALEGLAGAPR